MESAVFWNPYSLAEMVGDCSPSQEREEELACRVIKCTVVAEATMLTPTRPRTARDFFRTLLIDLT